MSEKQLTAIIIDDEQEAIAYMEEIVRNISKLTILGSISIPERTLSFFLKTHPDILFLDIQMPGMDGFDVLKELHDHKLNPYVIFTTAYDQHALRAIKAGAFDYLLKPVDPEELITAIEKVKADFERHSLEQRMYCLEQAVQNHRKLRFNTRSGFILIHPDEIFYIEADANYSEVYLSKEKREVVSMNLGAIEEILPTQFIRISRSLIINSNYLIKLSGVNKRCTLRKDGDIVEFTVPEKQMSELRRAIR